MAFALFHPHHLPQQPVWARARDRAGDRQSETLPAISGGYPLNPWCFSLYGGSAFIYLPPSSICDRINCIPSFWASTNGYMVQCVTESSVSLAGYPVHVRLTAATAGDGADAPTSAYCVPQP